MNNDVKIPISEFQYEGDDRVFEIMDEQARQSSAKIYKENGDTVLDFGGDLEVPENTNPIVTAINEIKETQTQQSSQIAEFYDKTFHLNSDDFEIGGINSVGVLTDNTAFIRSKNYLEKNVYVLFPNVGSIYIKVFKHGIFVGNYNGEDYVINPTEHSPIINKRINLNKIYAIDNEYQIKLAYTLNNTALTSDIENVLATCIDSVPIINNIRIENNVNKLSNEIMKMKESYNYFYEDILSQYEQRNNSYYDITSTIAIDTEYIGVYHTIEPIEVNFGDIFDISISVGLSKKQSPIVITDKDFNVLSQQQLELNDGTYDYKILVNDSRAKYLLITYRNNIYRIKKLIYGKKELKGKYVSVLGDSISSYIGTIPQGNNVYYTGTNAGVSSVEQMWWKVMCNITGLIPLVINGWSGSCVTSGVRDYSTWVPSCDLSRCQALHDENHTPDIILIAMGVNDYSYNATLGEWNGNSQIENTNDFSQAYAFMLDKIHSAYPNAQIYCITPWFNQRGVDVGVTYKNSLDLTENDYANKIKKIAYLLNAKVIDGSNIGFNKYNYYPTYCIDSSTSPTHPNAKGQIHMGNTIAKYLINDFTHIE